MISLDTNVLVRFITEDDSKQLQKVANLLLKLENNNEQAFVSMLVLLEVN